MIMIMIRTLGYLFVFLSCTRTGFLYAKRIQQRIEDLKASKSMAILLRGDIRYAKTPLPEAIDHVVLRHDGRLTPFLSEVSAQLKQYSGLSFREIWENAARKELNQTSLSQKDKECFIALGEQLGYLDKEMQMNSIDWYIDQVEEQMREVSKDAKQKMRLYQSLGILAGLFVVVLFL